MLLCSCFDNMTQDDLVMSDPSNFKTSIKCISQPLNDLRSYVRMHMYIPIFQPDLTVFTIYYNERPLSAAVRMLNICYCIGNYKTQHCQNQCSLRYLKNSTKDELDVV